MRSQGAGSGSPSPAGIPTADLDPGARHCRKGPHLQALDEGRSPMDRQPVQSPHSPASAWLPVGTSLVVLLSATAVVTQRLGRLQERIEQAEGARSQQAADVHTRLEQVQTELSGIRAELGTAFEELEGTTELSHRLEDAEQDLGSIGAAIEAHSSSLLVLEESAAAFAPDLERRLGERDERLQKRYEALSELAESAQRAASDTQERLAQLDQSLSTPPDLPAMWRELVGPVVQLAGDASVGSGVLLSSEPQPQGGFLTHILT